MIEAGRRYKVKKGNVFVEKGTIVTVDKDKETNQVIRGKTGMIFCSIDGKGSLSFDENDLESID